MKLTPLLALVAVGCSVTSTESTTTLLPLPTTVTPTLPSEDVYTSSEYAFFDDAVYYFDGSLPYDDETALGYGELWCELLEQGMQDTDVVERINEGASDEGDREAQFSIVLSAISNICPTQTDKAEYIALNAPLP